MVRTPKRARLEAIDLTLDSSPEPEADRSFNNSKANTKLPDIILDDDDDGDEVKDSNEMSAHRRRQEQADAAFARRLQDEDEAQYSRESAPLASTSSTYSYTSEKTNPRASGRAATRVSTDADPGESKTLLVTHRELFLGEDQCSCGAQVPRQSTPVLSTSSLLSNFVETGHFTCKKCQRVTCRGCREPKEGGAGECCAAVRAIILFNVLSALDRVYLKDHLKKPSHVKMTSQVKTQREPPSGQGSGTGYGSGATRAARFAGIGTDARRDLNAWGRGQTLAQTATTTSGNAAADLAQDELYLSALNLVSPLLPRPDSPTASTYDYLPHPTLAALLELSTLPDLLATLLRNDSVSEWQKQSRLYFAMLDVLRGLGSSEATFGTMFGKRRDKKWSQGIGAWLRGDGEIVWEREDPLDTAKKGKRKLEDEDVETSGQVVLSVSLFSLLQRLAIQADAFRKAALSGDFDDEDAALIGICGDFTAAGEHFVALSKLWTEQQTRDGKGDDKLERKKTASRRGWNERDYDLACARISYKAVDLSGSDSGAASSILSHYYYRDISATASSRRGHASFVHLVKELAVLSTSLPPGIFLRVDEARIDVIKVLIAGPQGTPYSGGLFEFDVFIPLQYPQSSPQVWLKTTGGGRVRFNPNLYAEGKVCLSLLGTWPGSPEEMWQPNASTVLQVLISISSMIFCSFPFYNEPGFGAAKDDHRNKHYNMNISLANVRHAMLDWMSEDKKSSIWAVSCVSLVAMGSNTTDAFGSNKDVIYAHFMLRRSEIAACVRSWAMKDDRLRKWSPRFDSCAGTDKLQPYGYGNGYGFDGAGRTLNGDETGSGRDLVGELEEAFERMAKWKGSDWCEDLLET